MTADRTKEIAPLHGDVDLGRALRAIPTAHAIKGMFVAPNAEIVAADWRRIEGTLRAPPRTGRYLPFIDYPLVDHVLLSDLAARAMYRGMPTCEAHRLLARRTMDTFSKSALGRVALTFVTGPTSLLMKYEEVFNRTVTGPHLSVRAIDESHAELTYSSYYGLREAIFGVIEGAILACELDPRVLVDSTGDGSYVAQVSWTHA